MKKKTAILFASSEVYAYAMFVAITSLLEHSPRLAEQADIFIYAYRWSDKTKKIFTGN